MPLRFRLRSLRHRAVASALCVSALAAALPALAEVPGVFGVFRNRAASPDPVQMQYIGAEWSTRLLRPLEPTWWYDADNTLTLQCGAGMQQIFTLSTAPDSVLDAHFPADLPAWADSVGRVVERYDGDGFMDMPGLTCPNHYWHIEAEDTFWKDTIDQYLTYLAVTRAAILAADPTAKVITMGLSSAQTWNAAYYAGTVHLYPPTQGIPYDQLQDWMSRTQRLLTEGAYDILDIHMYETHNVIAGKLAWLRSLMPPGRDIWACESGAPFYTRRQGYTDTLNSQAEVALYAEALANGMGAVAFGFLPPSPGNFDNTEQFINASMTRWNPYPTNAQPKPAYEAYSQLTEKLGGFTSAVDLSDRSGSDETQNLYDMRFTTPRGVVDVVWSPGGTRTIQLPVAAPYAKVTKLVERAGQTKAQAQVLTYGVLGGVVTLSVTNDPVFVEASGTLASGLGEPGAVADPTRIALALSRTPTAVDVRCTGASGAVEVTVSDVRGARVGAMRGAAGTDGIAELRWDLTGAGGGTGRVAPGVYFLAASDARGRRGTSRVMVLR